MKKISTSELKIELKKIKVVISENVDYYNSRSDAWQDNKGKKHLLLNESLLSISFELESVIHSLEDFNEEI